jgi:hypothetical protein
VTGPAERHKLREGARWTAPSNKELKLTKPSQDGASQLNSVLCGPVEGVKVPTMLGSLFLLVLPVPACSQPNHTLLSGDNYKVSVECRAQRDGLHFSITVSNLEEPGGPAIERLGLSFRGHLRHLSGPRGWTVTRKSIADEITTVRWQAKPKKGVAGHGELRGFAATVDGPSAAPSCRYFEISFGSYEGPEGVGIGGGAIGGCIP